MLYGTHRVENLMLHEDSFGDKEGSFGLPRPTFIEDGSTSRASLRKSSYRGRHIRRVVIEPPNAVLREHAMNQLMDILQQIGETALQESDALALQRLDIPTSEPLHPDGYRYIDGLE